MKAMILGAALAIAAGAGSASAQAPIGDFPHGGLLLIGQGKSRAPIQCGLAQGFSREPGGLLNGIFPGSLAMSSTFRGDTADSAVLSFPSLGLNYNNTAVNPDQQYTVSYFGAARLVFTKPTEGTVQFVAPPLVSVSDGEPPASAEVTFNNFTAQTAGDDLLVSFGLRIVTPEAKCNIRFQGAFAK